MSVQFKKTLPTIKKFSGEVATVLPSPTAQGLNPLCRLLVKLQIYKLTTAAAVSSEGSKAAPKSASSCLPARNNQLSSEYQSCLNSDLVVPFAHATQVATQNFLLPVPLACPISQLLARCNKFCANTAASPATTADAMRIFVNESFEIVDHSQLVGECFTDFMEVTVKALLRTTSVSPKPTVPKATTNAKHVQLPEKKFTREPSTMDSLMKTIKDKKSLRTNSDQTLTAVKKRQKLDVKQSSLKEQSSPDKESKNARKRRERKALEKKLVGGKSPLHRQSESLSSGSEAEEVPTLVVPALKSSSSVRSGGSRHSDFIKCISDSIQNYSLEKASANDSEASSDSDESSTPMNTLRKQKRSSVSGLDSLICSSDDL